MRDIPQNQLANIDIRIPPNAGSQLISVSEGRFASREMYRLRLQAEHALLVSGFDELICLDLLKFGLPDITTPFARIRHLMNANSSCLPSGEMPPR